MDNNSVIPDNWKGCNINDVSIKIHYGYTATANEIGRGSKYLRITDIQDNKVNWDTVPFCEIDDEEIEKFELKENDIVFARTGGTVGKSFLIKNDVPSEAVFASYLIRIKLSNYVDKKYIYLFFQSLNYWSQIELGKTGLKTNVNAQILSKLKLNLAPLPEQRAIVSKIEQLFSDLDNGIANLKKAQEQLKIYRQAVLKKAFVGEFTRKWREEQTDLPSAEELLQQIKEEREKHYQKQRDEWKKAVKEWEDKVKAGKKPIQSKKPITSKPLTDGELETLKQTPTRWHILRFIDLIKYEKNAIKRGPFGSAIKKSFFVSSGYKVYEQQNAINDDPTLGNYYINEEKYKELDRFSVKGGDYIVSCSGTIGRIHKLPMDCEPGVINQALLKIVLDEKLMLSKYFLYLFRSKFFQRKILKGTRGTGMQNLASVDEIKTIPIQLPPKTEQHQIVKEIETRLSVCDKLEATIAEAQQKSGALRQSILKKAFVGELLSEKELEEARNAPDWEPADKLLERIKAEKEKPGTKKSL